MNKGGVILAGLGAVAAFILWPKSASASQGGGAMQGAPSSSDITGSQEAQYLQGLIETAIASNNPKVMHATATKIRNTNWTHSEVRAAAKQEANNLDDYANSLENYQKSSKANAPAGPALPHTPPDQAASDIEAAMNEGNGWEW